MDSLPNYLSYGAPLARALRARSSTMIERGRYQIDQLPRENKLCPLCNSNQVEDEIHFLFQCNKYSVQRQVFSNQINRIIPDNFDKKSSPESMKLIMNLKEHHVSKLVMRFVFSCMYENT